MLSMNYIGFFNDLCDPVDHVVPSSAHSVCHVAKCRCQQHRLMPCAPKSIGKQFDNRFRPAVARQGQIGDKNSQNDSSLFCNVCNERQGCKSY